MPESKLSQLSHTIQRSARNRWKERLTFTLLGALAMLLITSITDMSTTNSKLRAEVIELKQQLKKTSEQQVGAFDLYQVIPDVPKLPPPYIDQPKQPIMDTSDI